MGISYATAGDYAALFGPENVPADISYRLRMASEIVRDYTRTAQWATDTNGYATKASIRNALRDATCIHAKFALTTGSEGGISAFFGDVSIGNLRLGSGSGGKSGTSGGRVELLCDEAMTILRNENLLDA